MALRLLTGPANAGKVELLLTRYLDRIEDEPYLVVPSRADIERAERDLLARSGCLLGGSIVTFDGLLRRILAGDSDVGQISGKVQREVIARRVVAAHAQAGSTLSPSARFPGFADALLGLFDELEAGLVEPAEVGADLGSLYADYRAELRRLGLWDEEMLRRHARDRLGAELDSWHAEPVFVYGFEDFSATQWDVLDTIAGRAEIEVSLPYEPGRVAFASLQRTCDRLAALAEGRLEERAPRADRYVAPALAHLERALFEPSPPSDAIDGAVAFLAGAGERGTLELVAAEVLGLLGSGTPPEQVALVVPSIEPYRAVIDTVFATSAIPVAFDGQIRLPATPFGEALVALLVFAWSQGGRHDLYTFLRSPYSGVTRASVDYTEGRLRGRGVSGATRVEEETERLREAPLVALRALRAAGSPLEGVRALLPSMMRAAYGLDEPPSGEQARLDLRVYGAAGALLDELAALDELGERLTAEEILGALRRGQVPSLGTGQPGRVAVIDLLGARTRRFEAVFVLGLEEGTLPRRGAGSPFLDERRRRELGTRLERPDSPSRDRYLFYTACTRPTRRLYLVREAVDESGTPREASPFWHAVADAFSTSEVERATTRRTLAELTWPIEAAPTERERLRALARMWAAPPSRARAQELAAEHGWTRKLDRARGAFSRMSALRHPDVLADLAARTMFSVTELERFGDCSAAWFFERFIGPRSIDAQADAMLRGQIAHQALYAFYGGLSRELGGIERVTAASLAGALAYLRRCIDDAFASGMRLELSPVEEAELREGLYRDLERFVREEAASELRLVPGRLELSFGTGRSVPELQRGLSLGDGLFLSGKIDRVDIDPLSARGIVQDYKTGRSAFSASQIERQQRLQVPLYMLVLRDLAGIEPIGGVYRALGGDASARAGRGMLRSSDRDDLPGFSANDYLDEEPFWAQAERAREQARVAAQRIRGGQIERDPRGGSCPEWCELWTMCRRERP